MSHTIITIAIIFVFVLISLFADRLTLQLLKLKPTWHQVFRITGTIFGVQLALALPSLINPKISIGPLLSVVSIVLSIIIWCVLLRRLFGTKLLKSLLGVLIFYALTASIVCILLLVAHFA